MELLNDLALRTRTHCSNFGEILSELGYIDFYGKYRPAIYYEKGIKEIDNLFDGNVYYKQGYVSNLICQENSFNLIFMKYDGEYCKDLGGLYISRDDIIGFEEFDANNLETIKDEEVKERMNYMWKKGSGIIGHVTGGLTDKLIKVKTHKVGGSKFVLSYYDKENKINKLTLYASDEYFQDVYLFINTYYKKELSQEAKDNNTGSNSNCFIATACYKDYYSEEVNFFRKYRDLKLSKSIFGKLFIKFYYQISPHIYKTLFKSPKISKFVKAILDKIYLKLK